VRPAGRVSTAVRDSHGRESAALLTLPVSYRTKLPSGKLEEGETVSQAAVREGFEEIGIRIAADALRFVHLMHYRSERGDARIGIFFQALDWEGEPFNAEPGKCAFIKWWPLNQLPQDTYPYTAEAIKAYMRGEYWSVVGWPDPDRS
jgi:ADP-ribose pyrophosphatase YjhB (NUDIX family)